MARILCYMSMTASNHCYYKKNHHKIRQELSAIYEYTTISTPLLSCILLWFSISTLLKKTTRLRSMPSDNNNNNNNHNNNNNKKDVCVTTWTFAVTKNLFWSIVSVRKISLVYSLHGWFLRTENETWTREIIFRAMFLSWKQVFLATHNKIKKN